MSLGDVGAPKDYQCCTFSTEQEEAEADGEAKMALASSSTTAPEKSEGEESRRARTSRRCIRGSSRSPELFVGDKISCLAEGLRSKEV